MDLGDLLQRAQQGEQAAQDELYRLLKPVLRPIIARILRQSAAKRVLDPTDLIQTAWRRLLKKGTMPDNLEAWLCQVARRRLFQVQKSHGVSRTHLDEDGLAKMSLSKSNSPLEIIVHAEELERVRQHLVPAVYESLMMFNAGDSWVEIAAVHAPPGIQTESWAKRCGRKLAECREAMS